MDNNLVSEHKAIFDLDNVFNTYYPRLVLFALKLTGNKEDSEEIVQDVFIKIWMKQGSLSINYSVKGFLFKSVFNACLDYLRKETILKKRNEQIFLNYVDVVQFRDPILEEELETAINNAISELPAQCERIFRLKKEEGLTYKEIAVKLNISEKTVEAQVYKGLKHMKRKLSVLILIFP